MNQLCGDSAHKHENQRVCMRNTGQVRKNVNRHSGVTAVHMYEHRDRHTESILIFQQTG